MTLEQLIELMQTPDLTRVQNVLQLHLPENTNDLVRIQKEYEPFFHKIKETSFERKDKLIRNAKGEIEKIVKVAKLPIALQKKIVLMAAAFLGVPRIDCTPNTPEETDLWTVMQEIFDANRLDYKFSELARLVMSERHAAELWYPKDVDNAYDGLPIESSEYELSVRLLANSLGDWLYPVFDEYQTMIAFGRAYQIREINPVTAQVELTSHFDVYTADEIFYTKRMSGIWLFSDGEQYSASFQSVPNIFKKIPVIYYHQPLVEWADVQDLIERMEVKISNHADTNDYFDSPVIVASGQVDGFAEKEESGKLLIVENGAKVEYLTWDSAPASMKLELDNLNYLIHSLTHTPDISFENLKGLGKLSGIALKLLFMDAHLKAGTKEPIFAEGVKRRLNWIKAALAVLDPKFVKVQNLKMTPCFKYFMPEDENAIIETLNAATEGGILSTESAIEQNPLVQDPDSEKTLIKQEQAIKQTNELALAAAAKPPIQPSPLPGKLPEAAALGY